MSNIHKKIIFMSLLWCLSLGAMHDKRVDVKSAAVDDESDSSDSSVNVSEWCLLDNAPLPPTQDDTPPLFCLDGQEGWSLVGGKQVAFGLVDSVIAQAAEMQKTAEDAQRAYNEQKDIICVLMRRTSPDYCHEVEESLRNNFQGTGIDYRAVYDAIGIPFDKGKDMAHTQIGVHLEQLRDAEVITLKQYRQLCYPFRIAQSKEEYDAFCTNTLERLMCGKEEQQQVLQEFKKIVETGPRLADIHYILRQFEDLKVSVGGV